MLRAIQNSVLSIIYPQPCQVCSGMVEEVKNGNSCHQCWFETRIFAGREMLCDKCGALLGEQAAVSPVRCRQCDDYFFDKAFAIGVYEKALAAAVVELKNSPHLSAHVRSLIKTQFTKYTRTLEPDLIIPVPLSKIRSIERGFNQAEIIAAEVGRVMRVAVDSLSLTRTLHTPIHRGGMDKKARELTVVKGFSVTRPNLVKGREILLVDDVLTSGATSSACARALKRAGSGSVTVFTLARAVLN